MERTHGARRCESLIEAVGIFERLRIHRDYGVDIRSLLVVRIDPREIELDKSSRRELLRSVGVVNAADAGFNQMERHAAIGCRRRSGRAAGTSRGEQRGDNNKCSESSHSNPSFCAAVCCDRCGAHARRHAALFEFTRVARGGLSMATWNVERELTPNGYAFDDEIGRCFWWRPPCRRLSAMDFDLPCRGGRRAGARHTLRERSGRRTPPPGNPNEEIKRRAVRCSPALTLSILRASIRCGRTLHHAESISRDPLEAFIFLSSEAW